MNRQLYYLVYRDRLLGVRRRMPFKTALEFGYKWDLDKLARQLGGISIVRMKEGRC